MAARSRLTALLALFGASAMVTLAQTYTLLHEGGHALVVWLSGGRLTRIDLSFWDLGAHIGYEGAFGPGQQSLLHLAGVALPYLVWAGALLLLPRRTGAAASWLKAAASLGVLSSLLPWAVIPLLPSPPLGDDVTRFVTASGAPAWLVAAGALLLLVLGSALFAWRTADVRLLPAGWRRALESPSEARVRRLALVMTVWAAASVVLAVGVGLAAASVT